MNFYTSTQNKLHSRDEINAIKKLDKSVLKEDYHRLEIFAVNLLYKFGKKMTNRQRVLSTAAVYLKRFYLYNNYLETDLYLVIITSLYVSSKVEELPISIRLLSSEGNKYFSTGYTPQSIGKMEFSLISDLDCELIIHHPLLNQFQIDDNIKSLCYYILNDIYKTNLLLLYQPFYIAIAIITFAYSTQSQQSQPIKLLSELNCELSTVYDITQQIHSFYSLLPSINDDSLKLLYLNSHL